MAKEILRINAELEGTKEEIKEQVCSILAGTIHSFDIDIDELKNY